MRSRPSLLSGGRGGPARRRSQAPGRRGDHACGVLRNLEAHRAQSLRRAHGPGASTASATGRHRAQGVVVAPVTVDALVIGAGFAGLSAAVRLARSGARVLVLEARFRPGGRAAALADRETGALVDNGQHILLGCYTETFGFLREIGALDNVQVQPQLRIVMIDRDGRRSRLVCPPLPAPFHLLAGVLEWPALTWSDKVAALRMITPIRLARRELRPG